MLNNKTKKSTIQYTGKRVKLINSSLQLSNTLQSADDVKVANDLKCVESFPNIESTRNVMKLAAFISEGDDIIDNTSNSNSNRQKLISITNNKLTMDRTNKIKLLLADGNNNYPPAENVFAAYAATHKVVAGIENRTIDTEIQATRAMFGQNATEFTFMGKKFFAAQHKKEQKLQLGRSGGESHLNYRSATKASGRCCRHRTSSLMNFLTRAQLVVSLYLVVVIIAVGLSTSIVNAIKLQPEGKDKFYWSGEQFVITCQNNNNIKNVKIRWIGPSNSFITEDRSQRVHVESSGPHSNRLVVMNATVGQDEGQYRCTIVSPDDRPREHAEFVLKLLQTTSFKDSDKQLSLLTGRPGTLTCRVEFDQNVVSPSVNWLRDGRPIDMLNDSSLQVYDYDANKQLSQLYISQVKRQHEGTYACRALAITSYLSKINEFEIKLETNFEPTFDSPSQVVWVESGHSIANRLAVAAASHNNNTNNNQQQHRNVFTGSVNSGASRSNRLHKQQQQQQQQHSHLAAYPAANGQPQQQADTPDIVRVELKCTCEANPPASIVWTSTMNKNYMMAKGLPEHVVEEPVVSHDGHNTTSTLTIGYKLDPSWSYRRDTYLCSASNKFGEATKSFTIEQGDSPPAFNIGPDKTYNAQTSLFRFTLLGPNFDPESQSSAGASQAAYQRQQQQQQQQQQREIMPPIDSFRIRSESPSSPPASTSGPNSNAHSRTSFGRRHLDASVTWNLDNSSEFKSNDNAQQQQQQQQQHSRSFKVPQNITVNLGKLSSGVHRLFLEAHNAVGWSPNATYLGDFYIVSGGVSTKLMLHSSWMLSIWLIVQLATNSLTLPFLSRNVS